MGGQTLVAGVLGVVVVYVTERQRCLRIPIVVMIVVGAAQDTLTTLLGRIPVRITDGDLPIIDVHTGDRNVMAARAAPIDQKPVAN